MSVQSSIFVRKYDQNKQFRFLVGLHELKEPFFLEKKSCFFLSSEIYVDMLPVVPEQEKKKSSLMFQ